MNAEIFNFLKTLPYLGENIPEQASIQRVVWKFAASWQWALATYILARFPPVKLGEGLYRFHKIHKRLRHG